MGSYGRYRVYSDEEASYTIVQPNYMQPLRVSSGLVRQGGATVRCTSLHVSGYLSTVISGMSQLARRDVALCRQEASLYRLVTVNSQERIGQLR